MSGADTGIFEQRFPTHKELRALSTAELAALAERVRRVICEAVKINGGHLASNLGVVEITIALHCVFDFSVDRLIFDVSHQCYPHKILTGRAAGFRHLRNPGGVSGFSNPDESAADVFVAGHAGTAVSTAAGLAVAYERRKEARRVVAFVGDAAMQNGMSLEAMNHAGSIKAPLLVVLNDNEMGISPTVGAISGQISRLRMDRRYLQIKEEMKTFASKVPVVGRPLQRFMHIVSDAVGRAVSPGAIFELMGFRYYGPADGHDIGSLITQLENTKNIGGPVVFHVVTKKGRGDPCAEQNPIAFHSAPPAEKEERLTPTLVSPKPPETVTASATTSTQELSSADSYSDAFGKIFGAIIAEDSSVVAVTAAMAEGTGLATYQKTHPDRVFDVGIAEGHAVGFAAGLAVGGMKPIVAIYSTFMQRALDQVFEELSLQNGVGVVIAMDRSGVVGGDGATHQGIYDIALFGAFPGIIQMAPRDAVMLDAMLRMALRCQAPCVIRYPKDKPPSHAESGAAVTLGKGEVLRAGRDVALMGYGAAVQWALDAARILDEKGCNASVIDLRFAAPLDADLILHTASSHKLVFTIEDGIIEGGVGRRIAARLAEARALSTTRIVNLGVPDGRLPHAERTALLAALGLSPASIAARVLKELD